MTRTRYQRGFSFVEIVVAIVIMSIIAVGLVEFITNSASGYSTTATRNQVNAAGRIVIDRLVMDLHNALGRSVRISTPLTQMQEDDDEGFAGDQCIEFLPVRAATTYLDPAFRPAAHKPFFDVVDFVPDQVGAEGVYAVIYPTSTAQLYDVDLGPGGSNITEAIARVDVSEGVDDVDKDRLTYMSDEPVPAPYDHRFRRESAVDRIFLVDQPVSYCITGTKLYRYTNYGFTADQMLPLSPDGDCIADLMDPLSCLPATTPDRVLITDQLDQGALSGGAQAFDQIEESRQRNAVIQLELNFAQDGERVRLNHEVLLQMTP